MQKIRLEYFVYVPGITQVLLLHGSNYYSYEFIALCSISDKKNLKVFSAYQESTLTQKILKSGV